MNTRYDAHMLTNEGRARIDAIHARAEALAVELEKVLGAEGVVALRHLQVAVLLGVRAVAVAHHEHQPRRGDAERAERTIRRSEEPSMYQRTGDHTM